MTIFDVRRLTNHWRKNPPLRVLVRAVAASLGVEFKEPSDKSKYLNAEEFKRLVEQTSGGATLLNQNG
jgi:hypothetical protein